MDKMFLLKTKLTHMWPKLLLDMYELIYVEMKTFIDPTMGIFCDASRHAILSNFNATDILLQQND